MKLQVKTLMFIPILAAVVGLTGVFEANATPAFARKEHKKCMYCHLNPHGGGARGFRGIYYQNHGNSFKGFKEKVEAKKAGVKPGAMAEASKPTNKNYKVVWKKGGWKPGGDRD